MGFANYAVVGCYNSTSKCKWTEPNFEVHDVQVKCCICRAEDTREAGRVSPLQTPLPQRPFSGTKDFFYIKSDWAKRRE